MALLPFDKLRVSRKTVPTAPLLSVIVSTAERSRGISIVGVSEISPLRADALRSR